MFTLLVHSTSVLYSKLSPYFLTALIVASAVSCFVRWNEMCPPACHGKWCVQFSVLSALRILTESSTCGTVSRECDSDTHLWFSQLYLKLQWNFDVFLDMKNENKRSSKHKIYLGQTKQCMFPEQISCAGQLQYKNTWAMLSQKWSKMEENRW